MPQPRASTTARGYGSWHQRLREQLLAYAREHPDTARCWRCTRPLADLDDIEIHLGHHDVDRTQHRGLECATCNLRAAAEKTNAQRRGEGAAPPALYAEYGELVVDVDDL